MCGCVCVCGCERVSVCAGVPPKGAIPPSLTPRQPQWASQLTLKANRVTHCLAATVSVEREGSLTVAERMWVVLDFSVSCGKGKEQKERKGKKQKMLPVGHPEAAKHKGGQFESVWSLHETHNVLKSPPKGVRKPRTREKKRHCTLQIPQTMGSVTTWCQSPNGQKWVKKALWAQNGSENHKRPPKRP